MPSLERFFDPQMRKFDANIRPLPGARLYFFDNNTTTPKAVYQDKQGSLAHTNPVIADSTGAFPQIFLDGLYSVELRSNKNIVQPGWPINNIGQDTPVVPFGPWNEINTYNTGEVVTAPNGNWYRSITDNNLGNDPISSPSEWEVIPIPVASSFTSNKSYLTWADDGDQVSLNVDSEGLAADVVSELSTIATPVVMGDDLSVSENFSVYGQSEFTGSVSFDGSVSFAGEVKANDGKIQIGPDVGPKLFINSEGESSDDDINYLPLANIDAVRVTGISSITSDFVIQKVGSMVTITSAESISHASLSSASAGVIVPERFRPPNSYGGNGIYTTIKYGDFIANFIVNAGGFISINYFDFSGASTSRTGVPAGLSITYLIQSEIP